MNPLFVIPTKRTAVCATWAILMAGFAGCSSRRTCAEAEEAFIEIAAECHLDYLFDDPYCDDTDRQYYECAISCAQDVPCEVLRGEDLEEHFKFSACMKYCDYITFAIAVQEGGK